MTTGKVRASYRIKHWFTHHPWLKLISLLLAIVVWFYVRGEIVRNLPL